MIVKIAVIIGIAVAVVAGLFLWGWYSDKHQR